MRESMREMLAGIAYDSEPRPKLVANNTVQYYRDGCKIIRLHHTDIIVWSADGKTCKLYTGGWKSRTTKDRLSQYAPGSTRIFSNRGIWYITNGVPFTEGVELNATTGALVEYEKAARKAATEGTRQQRLSKAINRFVLRIHALSELPQPNAGDCWVCSMFQAREPNELKRGLPGEGTGRKETDTSHLCSHIKESYLHGSLIINAMRWAGRTDFAIGYTYEQHKRDKEMGRYNGRDSWAARDLRRYLRSQLGLAT